MSDQYVIADCGFFTSVNGDRLYTADQMSNLYSGIVSNGVFPNVENSLLVEAGDGMNVTVHSGGGIFGGKWFNLAENASFEVPLNGSPHTRVDSVIIRIDSRTTERQGIVRYLVGNSDTPRDITPINNTVAYRVANITVPSGASSISASNISDLRGSSECPWCSSLVNNSTTASLGSISKSTFDNLDLTVGVVYTAGLTQGFLYTNSPGQSAMIIAVATDYTIIISALDGVFYVYGAAGARGNCEGATGSNSIQNGAVKKTKIPNYTVGFSQLTQGVQDTINEHTSDISALEEAMPENPLGYKDMGTLTENNALNSYVYCEPDIVYQFQVQPPLSTNLGIASAEKCELRYINGYQVLTVTSTQEQIIRKVNVKNPFAADSWTKIGIETGTISATATSPSGSDKTITGTYELSGDYCTITAEMEMDINETQMVFPLPVTVLSYNPVLALGWGYGSNYYCRVESSHLYVTTISGAGFIGTNAFVTLTYKYK